MAQAYLFVHFREKTTPDGEQVYFGISRDGFHWEAVNDGAPVLWAYYGDKGVRDFTITHSIETGKYYIFATDLSLSYGMRNQYHNSWDEIGRNGSKYFSVWESEDLVNWSDQRLVKIGDDDFGCLCPALVFFPCSKRLRSQKNLLQHNEEFCSFFSSAGSVRKRGQRRD